MTRSLVDLSDPKKEKPKKTASDLTGFGTE